MRRAWGGGLLQVVSGVFLFLLWAGSARAEIVAQPEAGAVQPAAEVVPPRAVESGLVIVTAESAEVRAGPSPNAEVIAVVDKGEIFEKLGRTMRWYLVKIDDEITGWISGRYIRRYQEGGAQSAYPSYDGRYYPYYNNYYEYPFYNWGLPYFLGDWYFYDRGWYGNPGWNHGRAYPPLPPGRGWPPPGVGPGGIPGLGPGGKAPPPGGFRPGGGMPGYSPSPGGGVPGGGGPPPGGGGPPPSGGMGPGPGPSGGMRAPAPRR